MLNQHLSDAFVRYHDKPAIIGHHGGQISFAKLDIITDRVAGRLWAMGVRVGSRVQVDLADVELKVAFWLAVWRLGADLIAGKALDVFSKYQIDPDVIISDQEMSLRNVHRFDESWLADSLPYEVQPEPGTMFFTTNATKRQARVVGVDCKRFWQDIENYQRLLGPAKGRFFFFSALDSFRSFRDVIRAFLEGQAIIGPHSNDLAAWNSICKQDVAEVFLAPLTLRRLVQMQKEHPCEHKIKRIFVASGTAGAKLLADAHSVFGAELGLAAGAMEVSLYSYLIYDPKTFQKGQIGQVQNGIKVRIVDGHGNLVENGGYGGLELFVPPDRRFLAYVNAEPAWDDDGWIDTGFIGSVDHEGCITKHGRTDDRINLGGVRLFSGQVEAVVLKIPQVEKVAAIRVYAEDGSEALGLAIELNAQVSAASIARTVKNGLSGVGDVQVALLEVLPLSTTGEPDRVLIEQWWEATFHKL